MNFFFWIFYIYRGPEEIIYQNDTIIDSIYFIVKGYVEIFVQTPGKPKKLIKVINQGQILGDSSFFTGIKTEVGAKTVNVVLLMIINKDIFL